jgi:hypothetical protein
VVGRLSLGHNGRMTESPVPASTRRRRVATWLELWLRQAAVVGAVAALLPGAAHAQGTSAPLSPPEVPAALQVPAGQTLLLRAFAAGTQNYACQTDASGNATWVFLQPKAVLVGDDGEPFGIHGRGPFWAAYDGSRVVGSAPVSAPGRDPAHDVPLLLLRGTPGETDGRLAGVSFIQRLDTHGGAAPAGSCDPDQQPTLAVPYVAVYYFYGPQQ